jgi:hypothetical protein
LGILNKKVLCGNVYVYVVKLLGLVQIPECYGDDEAYERYLREEADDINFWKVKIISG